MDDDALVDPILLIADEINKYGILKWPKARKMQECEAMKRTCGDTMPSGLECLSEAGILTRICESKAFCQRLGVSYSNIGMYVLDIQAGGAHLALRYNAEQRKARV